MVVLWFSKRPFRRTEDSMRGASTPNRKAFAFLTLLAAIAVAVAAFLAVAARPAAAAQFVNTAPLAPVGASSVSSTIVVSGQPTITTDVNVTLHAISHLFVEDFDVLLEGPTGVRVMVMSDVHCNNVDDPTTGVTVTFDDQASQSATGGPLSSGTSYKPTDLDGSGCDSAGDGVLPAAPNATTFAAFNGTNPNGTWTLYVADDVATDNGTIAGGWSLDLLSDDPEPDPTPTPTPPPSPSPAPPVCNGLPATIEGTSGDDVILGTAGNDVIVAGDGEDLVRGLGGNDIICGSDDDDILKGGRGHDALFGESGGDTLKGGIGTDRCVGGFGVDRAKKCERFGSL